MARKRWFCGPVWVERPEPGVEKLPGEKQKTSMLGKTENEGIRRIPVKTLHQAGLILLFAEKCPTGGADEHN